MARAIKLNGAFQVPTMDKPRWLRETELVMSDLLGQAIAAWLAAATAPIPAWSGASLGTFSKLAAEVGFHLGIAATPNGLRGGLGAGAGAATSTGSVDINASKGVYTFEYSTTLRHLIFNEYKNANVTPDPAVFSRLKRPGPYQFQEKGAEAFLQVAKEAALPFPRITSKRTIRLR
jgi:hypothetical protein